MRLAQSAVLVLVGALGQRAGAQCLYDQSQNLEHVVAVRIVAGLGIDDFVARLRQQIPGATTIDEIPGRPIYRIALGQDFDDDDLIPILEPYVDPTPQTPDPAQPLQYYDIIYTNSASEGHTGSIYFGRLPSAAAAAYQTQYAVNLLGMPQAHATSRGNGTLVAVLDTGVDGAHPALAGRIAAGGVNVLDGADPADTADAGDFLDNDVPPDGQVDEMVGHGTFVGGLIALTAPEARILPVKVLNSDGLGDSWFLADGMFRAIDAGAHVLNISLGSTYDSDMVRDAVVHARARGIVVVAAGGNCGVLADNEDEWQFPASETGVLGVMATDWIDRKAPFSNYGDRLALCAPGDSAAVPGNPATYDPANCIFSALPGGTGEDYTVWEGTSWATAFVSGAAALLRAQHPEWGACLTTTQTIEQLITNNAVDIDAQNPAYAGQLGAGRLHVAAAVQASPPANHPGDFDADGRVDLSDLTILLADFGAAISCRDLDNRPGVGLGDLAILLAHFGE